MYKNFQIKQELIDLSNKVEEKISEHIKKVNEDCMYNSIKVLKAYNNRNINKVKYN